MIVFRALQGMLGASMVPTMFTSSFHFFQGKRRVYSAAVVGTIASLAPVLGPVIGGWITDTWNWHWLFYVNLLPGIAVTVLTVLLVKIDEPDWALLKGADYPGIVLMAMALGTLEYVLEEGSRWNWFDDRTIRNCAWIAAVTGVLFIARSLTFARPVVDLRRAEKPQLRRRLLFVVCDRRRDLFDDLSDPAVSRLCARLQRLADRCRDLLDRCRVDCRRAGLCHARQEDRYALADDVRPRLVWRVDVGV